MKILVAVDGSQASLCAVRNALQLVREGLHADIVLATVQEPTYVYEMVLPPSADVLERMSGAVGTRALAGAEALLTQAGVAWTREIGSGAAVPPLIEIAERHGCSKILMGARGLGAVRTESFSNRASVNASLDDVCFSCRGDSQSDAGEITIPVENLTSGGGG